MSSGDLSGNLGTPSQTPASTHFILFTDENSLDSNGIFDTEISSTPSSTVSPSSSVSSSSTVSPSSSYVIYYDDDMIENIEFFNHSILDRIIDYEIIHQYNSSNNVSNIKDISNSILTSYLNKTNTPNNNLNITSLLEEIEEIVIEEINTIYNVNESSVNNTSNFETDDIIIDVVDDDEDIENNFINNQNKDENFFENKAIILVSSILLGTFILSTIIICYLCRISNQNNLQRRVHPQPHRTRDDLPYRPKSRVVQLV